MYYSVVHENLWKKYNIYYKLEIYFATISRYVSYFIKMHNAVTFVSYSNDADDIFSKYSQKLNNLKLILSNFDSNQLMHLEYGFLLRP